MPGLEGSKATSAWIILLLLYNTFVCINCSYSKYSHFQFVIFNFCLFLYHLDFPESLLIVVFLSYSKQQKVIVSDELISEKNRLAA